MKPHIVHKVVFELKYRYGFAYLDRCGRITNSILRDRPEWMLATTSPNPQNAPLVCTTNRCRFNFSSLKLDFCIEQERDGNALADDDLTQFISQVDDLATFVTQELDLKEFSRIGFRIWYLFPCRDEEEAETWLRDRGLYSFGPNAKKALGSEPVAASVALVIEGEDRRFRVSLAGVERSLPVDLGTEILSVQPRSLPRNQKEHLMAQLKVKKLLEQNPLHAAMIDLDAYQEEPKIVEPKSFIESSIKQGRGILAKCEAIPQRT